MDPNSTTNMTGEPNQAVSSLQFDQYPPGYANWNQQGVFANASPQFQLGQNFPQAQVPIPYPNLQPYPGPSMPAEGLASLPYTAPAFATTPPAQAHQSFSFGTPRPFPNVVQFPFQSAQPGFGPRLISIRCKRKTDSPPLQPCKQHITEDKMAEHMSKLHISSETVVSSKESESDRTQRLYMCEEMRKLKTDSLLPRSLISRIQRPCTALVLWQPPTRLLPLQNTEIDENDNNNEQERPRSGTIAIESEMESEGNNMEMDNC